MADQNILVRITGEADLTEAQVEMRSLNDRGKELEKQMQQLVAAEKLQTAALEKMSRATADERAKAEESLKTTQKQIRETQAAINQNQKNIQSLNQTMSSYNAMNGVSGKLAQRIKELREQMAQMEMAGDTSSQAFIEMGVEVAKLTDQIGDTQAQIRILASDTKNLDAAMSLGSGVAGAFNVATSAAALLGGESEELQQAFLKVQATMAVLNGVQQVANTLNKDSAANVVLRTALQKLFNKAKQQETANTVKAAAASGADVAAKGAQTAATGAATTATWSLNAAMLANPALLIVAALAALVAGIAYFISSTKKAKEEQRDFNGTMERTKALISDTKDAYDYSARLAEAEGKSWKEVARIQENGLMKQRNAAVRAYNDMVRKKKAANGKISEEEQKMLDDMREMWQQYDKDIEKHRQDVHIREVAEIRQQNEEKAQKEKEAAQRRRERAKEEAQRRAEEIRNAEKQLQDVRIALMEDGAKKEIAKINLDFKRKIAEIKGNSNTEIALRSSLEKQRQKAIQKVNEDLAAQEREQQRNLANLKLQNDVALAEQFGGEYLYETRKEVLQKQAELEIAAITESEKNEQVRAERIIAINQKLIADLKDLERQHAQEQIDDSTKAAEIRVKEAENAAIRILNDENSTNEQIKEARETLANHDKNLRDIRMQEITSMYEKGLMSEQQFQDAKLDIEREALDAETEMIEERAAQTQELVNNILQFVSDMASEVFGAISDHIQQQLDDLDEYYTTDAEEAKEDANKKYLSEKEMEDKKLALKRKAAAVEKAEAAFNIAMNTAMAIMRIWADVPKVDFGATTIAMTAFAAALGATQLAMVLAKPLPKYAKGRKRGKGEYAMVGERGAELMWIPDNASIVPHHKVNKPETWGDYGVPTPYIPAQPDIEREIMQSIIMQHIGFADFDYERMGLSVAKHIPEQKAVYVNVDRSGIGVSEGGDYHHYLNRKYAGAWS